MNFLRPFREFRAFLALAGPVFEGKRTPMAKAIGWSIAGSLVVLARPWPMKFVIDAVTSPRATGTPEVPWMVVGSACAATFGLALASGLCATEEAKSTAEVAKSITTRIRKRVFSTSTAFRFPSTRRTDRETFSFASWATSRTSATSSSRVGWAWARPRCTFVGGVLAMAVIHPGLALAAVLPLPLLLVRCARRP
jgi:ABC-type multidrug transport system fused ATPase/permease subunit